MQPLSFPFQQTCFFRLQQGQRAMALVEAEEAVTPAEVYQALNYRSRLHFNKPLVLHFENPLVQMPVWFDFAFDVEVVVVGLDGVVKKTYPVPRSREGSAMFVQFFADYAFAILVPYGFCKEWNVQEGVTVARRTRTSLYSRKTA
jgi:hypothetical protein